MKLNKLIKRASVLFVAVIMALTAVPVSVSADEVTAEQKMQLIDEVVNYLSVYARYESVKPASLYREGLMKVFEEHPELYEEIMTAMLKSIDENSEYYNPYDTELLKDSISGTVVVGIGITFEICEEGVYISSVIPGTPAAKAGLQIGDIIVSADDVALEGLNSDTAASYIKGEEGTSVKIGVKHKDTGETSYIEMVRERIVGTSVADAVIENDGVKIMYIRVYGFVSNTAECFKIALESARDQGIDNVIIDIRDNGGGLLGQAVEMADYLLPKGSIITTEDHKIEAFNYVYKSESDPVKDFNTVVLINENSASASEVLAAALSENGCAYTIGVNSYGKGTIQTIADLPFGDSMKYTIGYYLTPNGNNIHKVGLTPDEIVENDIVPFEIEKYNKFSYTRVYRLGETGPEIKTAKELLYAWGTYDGELDDVYDAAMEDAVYRFQAQTGLYPYGVLDYTTQHELYTRLELSNVMKDNQFERAVEFFSNPKEK